MYPNVLQRAAASAAVALLSFLATTVCAETVSPEPFFSHADYRSVRLSPSGRYLGALVPVRGRLVIAVLDLDTNTSTIAGGIDGADVARFNWVNDDRIAFSVLDLQSGLGEQLGGGLFAFNRDGSDFRTLAPTLKAVINSNSFVYRYTLPHTFLRDGSDDIIVLNNDNNARFPDIYRMNTKTGRKTPLYGDKPGDVVRWVVDRNGEVRGAVTMERGGLMNRAYWRASGDAKWVQMGEFALRGARYAPVAFDGDGSMIVGSDVGRATQALYRYDPAKKSFGEPVVAHPRADLDGGDHELGQHDDGFVYDWRKKRIVGFAYEGERPGAVWFDDDWAKLQATVDAALPGKRNELARGTERSRVLVFSYSDTDPGSYYMLDPDRRRLEFLAAVRKAIDPAKMPTRTPIHYTARDGLDIPAYLTLPKGKDAKNLPLVVYVHGGPFLRGAHWAWNAEAAWLASLGYAVLQPEFRGSEGWGRKHFEAGWKQWGRAMQDDLNDGVDWLAKQGTVDAKRACIMGGSYGGYAVMMGLARDPERWRCGVNFVGVTDITLMFDVTWSDFSGSDWIKYAAKELIGDPDQDAALFKAASPLENADRIKAPVFMAYGGADYRVPLVHGEKMRAALAAHGAPVEWVVYPDEGHGFMQEKVRFDLYRRVGEFLAKNLGAP